ncbi:MAG: hypothetical protein NT154_37820 [Verrucomicrobia bacterium]|nr:hypothetical protein [Verrucomicrobiota bacterium]
MDINGWKPGDRSMDAIKNSFSPVAGSPPLELVGREEIFEQARIQLFRKPRRP